MRIAAADRAPILICIMALVIIGFAFSLEQRRMIGDSDSFDPGSRALPLTSGVIMLVAGLYDTFRTRKEKGAAKTLSSNRKLFFATLGSSLAYILLLELIGFIPLTAMFLYALFVLYGRAALSGGARLRDDLLGLLFALAFTVFIYSLGRIISRELFYAGRSMGNALLASRSTMAATFFLTAGSVYTLAVKFSFQRLRKHGEYKLVADAIFLSSATTLFFYVVFRLLFRVNFPEGLLFW